MCILWNILNKLHISSGYEYCSFSISVVCWNILCCTVLQSRGWKIYLVQLLQLNVCHLFLSRISLCEKHLRWSTCIFKTVTSNLWASGLCLIKGHALVWNNAKWRYVLPICKWGIYLFDDCIVFVSQVNNIPRNITKKEEMIH